MCATVLTPEPLADMNRVTLVSQLAVMLGIVADGRVGGVEEMWS